PTQAAVDLAAVAVRRGRWPLALVAGVVAVLAVVALAWPRPAATTLPQAVAEPRVDAGLAIAEMDAGAAESDGGAPVLAQSAGVDAGPGAPGAGGITVKPMRGRGGQVRIVSTLMGEPWWTQVYVDGAPKGRTPLVVMLPPGRHRIRMERSGFTPQEQEISLGRGAALAVRFELQR
ncbi:MAG: PEGA domain-containing protein, partial [Myxococcaceae bacterium]|nr:PEGA domain-containing protein [Myxococcaceae bacterium]